MDIKLLAKYVLCVFYIIFSVSGLVLVKYGFKSANSSCLSLPIVGINIPVLSIVGIMCYGISFCLYMAVVANFDIGFIAPLLGGIVNVLILFASIVVLKEGLGFKAIIGAIIIVIGITVMNI